MRFGILSLGMLFGMVLGACAVPPNAPSTRVTATDSVSIPAAPTALRGLATAIPTDSATGTAASVSQPTALPTPSQSEQTTMSRELITAAARGDTARVRELISEGAPLNEQDANWRTAVMAATLGNHVESVRALLEAGADVNIRDTRLDNPFLYAGAEGYLEILKLAWAAGADPTITNRFGGTALIPACERGHVDVARFLLTETTVDVNHINNLGWTCLLEAIILSDGGPAHQEVVRLVIEQGADVNIADKEGVTPLQHATRRGYAEIERLLRDAGAH